VHDPDEPEQYHDLNSNGMRDPGYGAGPAEGRVRFSLRDLPLAPDPPVDPQAKQQALGRLYAFFYAMVQALPDAVLPADQKQETAASLAINTYDFYDAAASGSPGLPTSSADLPAELRPTNPLLGIEGLPFITEAYYHDNGTSENPSDDIYAVELFNPWPYPIALNEAWRLADVPLSGGTISIPGAEVRGRVNQDNSNLYVICNKSAGVPFQVDHGQADFSFTPGDQITLVHPSGVTVDWIDTPEATEPNTSTRRCLLQAEDGQAAGSSPWLGWRFCVNETESQGGETLKDFNTGTESIRSRVAPVHLLTADTGDASTAFPTTGTLLLVLRYAHGGAGNKPLSEKLKDHKDRIDNGHMPVFDHAQKIAEDRLDNPWGQLVFDYFTALPIELLAYAYQRDVAAGTFDPNDETAYRNWYAMLWPGLPIVERVYDPAAPGDPARIAFGLKVLGRINVNVAPWFVLDGLPLAAIPADHSPPDWGDEWAELRAARGWVAGYVIDPARGAAAPAETVGQGLARGMAHYRELREEYSGNRQQGVLGGEMVELRKGAGFVTVGELANLVGNTTQDRRIDAGVANYRLDQSPASHRPDYLRAVAMLVSLPEWLTVRGHTYTIYATLIDTQAQPPVVMRMQQTVDRTRCLYTDDLPAPIGSRVLVGYSNTMHDPS